MSTDTLILTATDHLAQQLRADHNLRQQQAGKHVWTAPAIHGLRSWITRQWMASWPVEQLLHPVQELALWRSVIERDDRLQLLSPLAAARMARNAEQLSLQYGIRPQQLQDFSEEQQAFKRWWKAVRSQRRAKGWLIQAELPAVVHALMTQGEAALPAQIELAGFSDPPVPSEQALLECMQQAGVSIASGGQASPARPAALYGYAGAREQFDAVAASLRDLLVPYVDEAIPPPRILVLLPDPDGSRNLLETSLRRELAPWLRRADDPARPLPWRFVPGQALPNQPVIALALAIAALTGQGEPVPAYSPILLNNILWSADESQAAAELDYKLREDGLPRYALRALLAHCPALLQPRLQALVTAVEAEPRTALPSEWIAFWQRRQLALGWPPTAPDSASYQALDDWHAAAATLTTLDEQLGRISGAAALAWLREIVARRPFEARVEYSQPIQILSLADATGIPCEHIFVLNANDASLPASDQGNAFLPRELLARAGMPTASPTGRLQQAQRRVQAWRAQCKQLHVYSCNLDEGGIERLPSPLFGPLQAWQHRHPAVCAATQSAAAMPASDVVPAVDDPSSAGIRGGSSLFEALVEAPFYAFCIGRLGIREFPPAVVGLDARRQGNVIHAALAGIWQELGDSKNLAMTNEDALRQLIQNCLQAALRKHVPAAAYGKTLLESEAARLFSLLLQWLGHERRRVDAFTVLLREQAVSLNILGLELTLRVDRVDTVATAGGKRHLILDYKTGREVRASDWDDDKLTAPQLPLYATHAALQAAGVPQVDGICFAHLRDGHPAFVSYNNWRQHLIETDTGKFAHDWPDQLRRWHARFIELVQGFLAGNAGLPAKLNPRSYRAFLLPLCGDAVAGDEE